MWEKLKAVYSQFRPSVIYSIFQKLLTYPKINKPKQFEKLVTNIFAKIKFLVKQLRVAVTPNKYIWDSIAIVIASKFLYKDFQYIILSLLGQGNEKNTNKI